MIPSRWPRASTTWSAFALAIGVVTLLLGVLAGGMPIEFFVLGGGSTLVGLIALLRRLSGSAPDQESKG